MEAQILGVVSVSIVAVFFVLFILFVLWYALTAKGSVSPESDEYEYYDNLDPVEKQIYDRAFEFGYSAAQEEGSMRVSDYYSKSPSSPSSLPTQVGL